MEQKKKIITAYSENVQLSNDDCFTALKTVADNSIDSVVTDPPYGLGFMGKDWDSFVEPTSNSAE